MSTPWNARFALRMQRVRSSAIRELLKLTQQPDIISFAGGLPAPEYFPVEQIEEAAQEVLAEQGARALQYSTTEGDLDLRKLLVARMNRYRIKVGPENVFITSGSQQALDLIAKMLINPGDRVLTEKPTYLGALQAFNSYQAQYVTVPIDEDGIQVDKLEEALRSAPKFLYILPNFQNPSGATLSLERRKILVEMANKYGVPIVEDDPYGQLRYEGKHLPPLVVLDAELNSDGDGTYYSGNVIYLSTFSKTLAPGLRVAWVVAHQSIIEKLVLLKQGADLHTSTFTQMVAFKAAKGDAAIDADEHFIDKHVRRLRQVYRERRDAMLEAMEKYFPPGVKWTHPKGGLFLWAVMPDKIDVEELFRRAVENKVAFVPGNAFYPDGKGPSAMRLNFSNAPVELIEEGIRRLGAVIKSMLES